MMKLKGLLVLMALLLAPASAQAQEDAMPYKGGSSPFTGSSTAGVSRLPLPVVLGEFRLGDFTEWTIGEPCPTVTLSGYASQDITCYTFSMHLHTDVNAKVYYRYAKVTGGTWVTVSDSDADSTSHTRGVTDVNTATQYKWQAKDSVAGCPVAWSANNTFTTCVDFAFSVKNAFWWADVSNNYVQMLPSAQCSIQVRYKRTAPLEGSYIELGWTTGDSGSCAIWAVGTLGLNSTYMWEYRYKDSCGNVSQWIVGQTGCTTGSQGHFNNTTNQCGEI